MEDRIKTTLFVQYVEFCEPKIKVFETSIEQDDFVTNFLLSNQQNDDSFISLIYTYGEITFCDVKVESGEETETKLISEDIPF